MRLPALLPVLVPLLLITSDLWTHPRPYPCGTLPRGAPHAILSSPVDPFAPWSPWTQPSLIALRPRPTQQELPGGGPAGATASDSHADDLCTVWIVVAAHADVPRKDVPAARLACRWLRDALDAAASHVKARAVPCVRGGVPSRGVAGASHGDPTYSHSALTIAAMGPERSPPPLTCLAPAHPAFDMHKGRQSGRFQGRAKNLPQWPSRGSQTAPPHHYR